VKAECVLCEVWNESLYATHIPLIPKKLKLIFPQYLDFRKTLQGKFITLIYVRNNVRNVYALLSLGGGKKCERGAVCYKKKTVPLI
jgi:hypothetical protein